MAARQSDSRQGRDRETDENTCDYPDYAGLKPAPRESGRKRGGEFQFPQSLPDVYSLLYSRSAHHDRRGTGRDSGFCLPPVKGTVQVLHHHGHGGNRPEQQSREARKERRQAAPARRNMLGRDYGGEPFPAEDYVLRKRAAKSLLFFYE